MEITDQNMIDYQRILNLSLDLICIAGMDGYFKYLNPAWEKNLGYTQDELLSKPFLDFIHPDDHAKNDEEVAKLAAGHQTIDFENRYIHKDGSIRHISWSASAIPDKKQIYCIGRDITERKRAEEILQDSKRRLQALSDATFEAIFFSDQGVCIDQSSRAEKIFGYSDEEAIGRHGTEWIVPEDREKVKNNMMSGYEKSYEVTALRKDGTTFPAEIQARMFDYQGRLIRVTALRDITERIQAEEALRESEERYKLATKGGNVGVWDWNLTTGHIFVSPNLKAMLGYEDDEINNHIDDWGRHVYSEDVDKVMTEATACIEGKKRDYQVEHRMVHKDGSIRWFLASGTVERDENGEAVRFIGTNTDITAMKLLQEKLRQAHKMEAIGTLAGGIAHEFNNILGIIIGNTELALDDVPEWNPAKECLDEIRSASLRAKDVVRQILSFTRKTPFERKPIQLGIIITESLKLLRATISKTISIQQEILCESALILASPTEIHQILINLCTNSIHAMEDGTGVMGVRLEVINLDDDSTSPYEGLKPGDYAKLTVKDSCKGIRSEIMDRILDPYFTTKDIDKGLGMGLAVVYGIVKKHNGGINIVSEVGEGTTVEVLFPLIEAGPEAEVAGFDILPTGTERILFVDDEDALVKMVKQLLERLGYEVVGKTDSIEALKLFQAKHDQFDLVVTDMAMPQMAGDRLVQELIKIRSDVPIILCTGHSDRIDEDKAKTLGVTAYTMKPFDKKSLAVTIRKVLDEVKS